MMDTNKREEREVGARVVQATSAWSETHEEERKLKIEERASKFQSKEANVSKIESQLTEAIPVQDGDSEFKRNKKSARIPITMCLETLIVCK